MTTPITPDQRAEKITVEGRECKIVNNLSKKLDGTPIDHGWYITDTDDTNHFLLRHQEGPYWSWSYCGDEGHWPTREAAEKYLADLPTPPSEPKCPECDGTPLINGKTPWEFACDWYGETEIIDAVKRNMVGAFDARPIPKDVHSEEFGKWMAHEYRLAMRKGIEISQRAASPPLPPAPDPQGGELPTGLGMWRRDEANQWAWIGQFSDGRVMTDAMLIDGFAKLEWRRIDRLPRGGWTRVLPAPAASPPPAAAAVTGPSGTVLHELGNCRVLSDGGLACFDCGERYGGPRFPDLVIDDDAWSAISPTKNKGGLLCPNCICARLEAAGLSNVWARFRSGPIAGDCEYRQPVPAQPQAEASEELARLERPVESSANCPKCGRHNYHYDARSQRNICPWFDCLHNGPRCATELDRAKNALTTARADNARLQSELRELDESVPKITKALADAEAENERLRAERDQLSQTVIANTLIGVSRDRVFGEYWKREGKQPENDAKLFHWTIKRAEAAESRAEQLAEALSACSVFVTPQERLRHWDEYKQDAARRIAALAPAPTTDANGA